MEGESLTQVSTPAGAVFLSYASQDAEVAKRICEALRTGGIEVWFDQSELRGGDAWDRQIKRQIHDCALFVPIISQNTHARLEGYFRREWRLAVERAGDMAENKAFLVPIAIDSTTEGDPSVPEKFRELQWTRLPDGQVPSAFIERVQRLLLSVEPDAQSTAWPTPRRLSASMQAAVSAGQKWGTKRVLPLAAVVVVLAALGYFAIDRSWTPKHLAAPATPPNVPVSAPLAAFSPPAHSIAVLPFVNLSGDKDQEYFSDGLAEELLNSLARINELQVAARTSSFYFKGKDVDLPTIARKLNVATVLEGSVRRSGHTIRITAQLNNTVTGYHLWSETYDRDLKDVLKLQTDIATAVANALKITLLGDLAARIEAGGTRNPAAFDAYVRALKTHYEAVSAKDEQAAIDAFTQALRQDSGYALAYAGRSLALSSVVTFWATPVPTIPASLDRALADARRTITLAPGIAEGYLALASAYEASLEFTRAGDEYERALRLAPSNARVLRDYGNFAIAMGRSDSGFRMLRSAAALDPLNYVGHMFLGNGLQTLRRYPEAIGAFSDALALSHDASDARTSLGIAQYLHGDPQAARLSCEEASEKFDNQPQCMAIAYHKLGRHADAEGALAKLKALWGDSGPTVYAVVYAQWGDATKALEWLDTALRLRSPGLESLKTDPLLDPLRNEPRFQAIERALKFPD
jgi:TolB-like protein/tetratricopeptide (TPR) repeat protein